MKTALTFAALAALLATPALADMRTDARMYNNASQDAFNQADTNHSGYLTRSEASNLANNWGSVDTNHDNVITQEEYHAAWLADQGYHMSEFKNPGGSQAVNTKSSGSGRL